MKKVNADVYCAALYIGYEHGAHWVWLDHIVRRVFPATESIKHKDSRTYRRYAKRVRDALSQLEKSGNVELTHRKEGNVSKLYVHGVVPQC